MGPSVRRIRRLEFFALDIPLHTPFAIATETITTAGNIAVRITTDDGLSGWGECSPYQTLTGETQATGLAVARQLGEALLDLPHPAVATAVRRLERVVRGQRAVKSAIDMALHDLAARRAGLPLYAFLGGLNDRQLITDMTIGIGTPEAMAEAALRFREAGFETLKIKLGETADRDIARLRAIRRALGPGIPLRTDANQGWDPLTARRVLAAMPELEVEYCEQPLPYWDVAGAAALRRNSPVPIMADESLFDPHDAIRLLQADAADAFNIKLTKAGGLHHALAIAAIAEAAGLPCQVGCFSESRLAITALAHFCLARPVVRYFDMDSPLMLAEDPVKGGITLAQNGRITVPDAPGLGAAFEFSKPADVVVG